MNVVALRTIILTSLIVLCIALRLVLRPPLTSTEWIGYIALVVISAYTISVNAVDVYLITRRPPRGIPEDVVFRDVTFRLLLVLASVVALVAYTMH